MHFPIDNYAALAYSVSAMKNATNKPIKAGDIVRFLPEWQDSGDDQIVFRAVSDESMGRVDVMAELGWAINPVEVVSVEMIESE